MTATETNAVYRSKDGRFYFTFRFVQRTRHIDIFCPDHPSLNGRDSDAHKTHLFSSGKLCFVSGKEPKSLAEAHRRAKDWAEYWLDYRETGEVQE